LTQRVVSEVKVQTKPNDSIQVINYWDNIYPLTNTLPASKPWIPYLSWYLKYPSIEKKYTYELTTNKPLLVVKGVFEENSVNSYEIAEIKNFLDHFYSSFSLIDKKVDILLLNQ